MWPLNCDWGFTSVEWEHWEVTLYDPIMTNVKVIKTILTLDIIMTIV